MHNAYVSDKNVVPCEKHSKALLGNLKDVRFIKNQIHIHMIPQREVSIDGRLHTPFWKQPSEWCRLPYIFRSLTLSGLCLSDHLFAARLSSHQTTKTSLTMLILKIFSSLLHRLILYFPVTDGILSLGLTFRNRRRGDSQPFTNGRLGFDDRTCLNAIQCHIKPDTGLDNNFSNLDRTENV